MRHLRRVLCAATLLFLAASPSRAQQPGAEANKVLVSRADLEALADQLEQTAQSDEFTAEVRQRARAQAAQVRERLRTGDFQVGDRIALRVEQESLLTDTFTVRSGREVLLPGIGAIPLNGVLRVELTDYLTQRLAQFVRNPRVRAQGLIRVGIYGAVGSQGFYTVPVDIPLDEVFHLAGGIAGAADMDKIRVERGKEILFDGEYLQTVITQGRTLDELSIQAGDRFVIPILVTRNPLQFMQTIQILLTLPITIYGLIQLFGH